MAEIFTIFEKKNPMNPEADTNRNTGVKSTGDVTPELSGREIFERCTVTHADMPAVSDASLYTGLFPRGLSPNVYGHTGPPERDRQIFRFKALIIHD